MQIYLTVYHKKKHFDAPPPPPPPPPPIKHLLLRNIAHPHLSPCHRMEDKQGLQAQNFDSGLAVLYYGCNIFLYMLTNVQIIWLQL